jgi:predicted dehydrogenase
MTMTYNVAVIGLGMGQNHLRSYSAIPDVQILATADIDEDRLKTCTATYNVPRPCTDYREVLAMPDIDAVSVCLPNFLHAPVTIEALQAGKHVLVEKPMAMSVQEAQAMIAEAARQGKTLAVSMNYRWDFNPDAHYLKQLITQGKLGEVYYIRSASLRRRTFLRGQKRWFTQKQRSGGGALIDMGPHMMDLSMWFAGDFTPVQVSGVTRTALMTDTDVDDLSSALIRLKGGAAIALESTWESFTQPGVTVTVMGTKGGAVFNLLAPAGQRLTLFSADGDTLQQSTPVDIRLAETPDASVQAHFIRSLRNQCAPENAGERGLAVMRVLEAVYQSSATGRDVEVRD